MGILGSRRKIDEQVFLVRGEMRVLNYRNRVKIHDRRVKFVQNIDFDFELGFAVKPRPWAAALYALIMVVLIMLIHFYAVRFLNFSNFTRFVFINF